MALVLFSQNHNYPASVRGMRHWAFGQLLAFVAAILFALHGKIPLFMTAGLANVLLVGVAAVLLSGSSQHFGRSVPRRLFTILLLIEVPLFAWLSSDFQLYLYRLLAVGVSMFILLLWQAKVIWQFGNGAIYGYGTGQHGHRDGASRYHGRGNTPGHGRVCDHSRADSLHCQPQFRAAIAVDWWHLDGLRTLAPGTGTTRQQGQLDRLNSTPFPQISRISARPAQ